MAGFKLGVKYSKALNTTYLDENGKENFIVMGCYGIGVSRTMAAAVEQNNDADGIIWPAAIAPYHAVIIPVSAGDPLLWEGALEIYRQLEKNGVEAVLDDRNERAGVKFKDADLIGYPVRITVGKKYTEEKMYEVRTRKDKNVSFVPQSDIIDYIKEILNKY